MSLVLTMSREDGAGKDVDSQFLLQNVQVLAVGTTALSTANSQGGGGRVNQGKGSQTLTAVTLAMHERDVPRVVFAAEYGSIYLTLMPPNAEERGDRRVDGGNLIPGTGQQ